MRLTLKKSKLKKTMMTSDAMRIVKSLSHLREYSLLDSDTGLRMREITSDLLIANMDLIESCVLDSSKKTYDLIELISPEEGIGTASLLVLPREQVTGDLDAFITLSNIYLHYFEQWKLAEVTLDHARGIIEYHLLPNLKRYLYKKLTPEEISDQVILAGIDGFLQLTSKRSRRDKTVAMVEVYFNGNKVRENLTAKDLGVNDAGHGIGLSLDWNGQKIFYCTERYYDFFSLHSSA